MNTRRFGSFRTVVVILVIGGIMFLALGGYLAPISRVVVTPLVDLQTWITQRYNTLVNLLATPADVVELRRQNADLEAEVARLQAEVIDLKQQNSEIQILSALVDFARSNPASDYVAATVIGQDPSPFLHYIFINRGSDDGIRRGMPVVTAQGLVGRVSAVTAGAARVQLISDPTMIVNVRLATSEISAVLEGSLTGEILLTMIPQEASIQTGELIVTSGLGGSYPPNILIGQVTGLRSRSFDLFQTASVQPIVDFSDMDIILVIRNFRPADITPLNP